MDAQKPEKDPSISDTVIMERPGLWEAGKGAAAANKAPAGGETRPVAPASPEKT